MTEPQPEAAIEAEEDDWDNDSAIDNQSTSSASTESVASSILKHRQEFGRTYHAYKAGKYVYPNDERELDRLDLQHHLTMLTFDGKLFTAPVPKEQILHRVLDVGTGTGIWAIDFADAHPESQVLGVDLSPIQPQFVAPNVIFQVDDLEEPWTFSRKFDFIYSRILVGSFADFPRFFKQSFDNLNPGGWIEMVDTCVPIQSDDGTLPPDSALHKWHVYISRRDRMANKTRSALMFEASVKFGRPLDSPTRYKSQLEEAGFTNINQTIYKWPQNRWPKDPKLKLLGMWTLESFLSGLEGFSIAMFTLVLGWSKEEVEVFLMDVRNDMKNPKIHSYWNLYVVYAQKPLE